MSSISLQNKSISEKHQTSRNSVFGALWENAVVKKFSREQVVHIEMKDIPKQDALLLQKGDFPLKGNLSGILKTPCFNPEEGKNDLIPQTVLKKQVPRKDGRERNERTGIWPSSVQGAVEAIGRHPRTGSIASLGGSGTLVGPHHVLTAGHVLYDHQDGYGWMMQSVTFTPGLNEDKKPFSNAKGVLLLSVRGWIKDKDPRYDFGMIILDRSIGNTAGWFGLLKAPSICLTEKFTITGYPSDKVAKGRNNNLQYTMSGPLKKVHKEIFEYEMDT